MSRNKIIALIGIAILFVTIMVLLFSGPSSNNGKTISTRKWDKTFDLNDYGPYGLSFLEELLISSGRFKAFDVYTSHKQMDSLAGKLQTTIMFVGEQSYLTYGEMNDLLEVVNNGNQLFLSLEKFPYFLFDDLIDEPKSRFISGEMVTVDIDHEKLNQYFIYNTDTTTYFWNVFETSVLAKNPMMTVYSSIQGYPNFVSVPYGAGTITLHLNPMFFVNYQLKRKEGFDHLLKTMDIIKHDEIHWLDFAKEDLKDIDATNKTGSLDHSILAEIFKYNSLKWAFIFFVIGTLLFFTFRARRAQKTIPVLAPKINDGIGFADTIAGIYYGRQKPIYLLKIMRRNFYENVKSSFFVDLKNRKSEKSIDILCEKSGYPKEKLSYLLKHLENNAEGITNDRLLKLDSELREFYIFSGAWSTDKLVKIQTVFSNIYRIKSTSYGYVIAGILTLIFGFVMLSYAIGYGVLFWPIGMVLIFIGVNFLKTPIIRMNKSVVEIFPTLGSSKTINREDIESTFVEGNYLIFETYDHKTIKLNLALVSIQDRLQLTNLETKNN